MEERKRTRVAARVNGEEVEFLCDPRQSLLECLRDLLNLTGTKDGCNDGNCGACAVLLNGQLVNSCLVLGVEVQGQEITTVEGLADWRGLHPLQQAFLDNGALQCGYCTPGMLIAAKALLDRVPNPTEEQIRFWLAGNLCRCTGYERIVRAIQEAASRLQRQLLPGEAVPDPQRSAEVPRKYRVIGTTPVPEDAVEKLTGRAIYGMDVKLPGVIHGKVLRSPHAHARIKSIDTSRAEAMPGVRAVITARDLPSDPGGGLLTEAEAERKRFRDNYLAGDKALYRGHPVAAVAALDPYLAEEALELIQVEYEYLPPVLDVLEAVQDGAPLLHEEMVTESLGRPSGKPSNVARRIQQVKGDPERGFAEADVVVEREFRVATSHQGYLEPQVATAAWTSDRSLTLWSSTQGAFFVRRDAAALLGLPASKVKVVPTETGGGFGGRNRNYLEPLAALLARKAGRPVRLAMTRAEVFQGTGPSPGCYARLKMGATRDGRITAAEAYLLFEAGSYVASSAAGQGALCVFAPYAIPHGRIDAYDVVLNKPASGSLRAPSAPQVAFAYESVIDEICEKIGMDPLEFRLKNAAREGTRRIDGVAYPRVGFVETLRAAKEHEHYSAPLEGPHRGRGVACGWWRNNGLISSCSLGVNPDGSVNLVTGSIDLASNARVAVAMQAAEVLGIPLEEIRSAVGDTDSVGYTAITAGSRTTFTTGWAAIEAARDLLHRMAQRAAMTWGVDPAAVAFADGVFTTTAGQERRLSFKEVAAGLPTTGGPLFVSATVEPRGVGTTLSAHIVDVEVDPQTGKVEILRYTVVQDVGRVVHPLHLQGQIQGAAAQGIGRALTEGYQFDERGHMLNTTFLDYRMPTAVDVPDVETIFVEVPNPGHPFGVRGAAEPAIIPPPAALAIAIHRAVGVRMSELPMTPARILEAIGTAGIPG